MAILPGQLKSEAVAQIRSSSSSADHEDGPKPRAGAVPTVTVPGMGSRTSGSSEALEQERLVTSQARRVPPCHPSEYDATETECSALSPLEAVDSCLEVTEEEQEENGPGSPESPQIDPSSIDALQPPYRVAASLPVPPPPSVAAAVQASTATASTPTGAAASSVDSAPLDPEEVARNESAKLARMRESNQMLCLHYYSNVLKFEFGDQADVYRIDQIREWADIDPIWLDNLREKLYTIAGKFE